MKMIKNLSKYIFLYIEFLKQNIKVMLEYKTDFIIGVFSTLISQFYGIFFVWVIFENIKQINGWTFYQITFVYGLLTLAKGIDMFFFDNLHALGHEYVKEGKFDIFLIRPLSSLFQLVASYTQQDGLGLFLLGIIVVCKSLSELHILLGFTGALYLVSFVLSGSAIISAINLIFATTGFTTINSYVILGSVNSFQEFAYYPLAIYPKVIGFILTWIFPYAFASFYPASFLFNKSCGYMAVFTPLIAIVLWIIALRIWDI